MEYLKIRRTKRQVRADGSPYAVPIFVSKTRKYGKVTSEQAISTKTPVLVTGAHDSGKTRWLTRLHEHSVEIWGAKHKAAPLYLDALSPIAAWCDSPAIGQWWDSQQATLPQDEQTLWKSLKQHARSESLPDYCRENKAWPGVWCWCVSVCRKCCIPAASGFRFFTIGAGCIKKALWMVRNGRRIDSGFLASVGRGLGCGQVVTG